MDKIRKLLRLAGGNANESEADEAALAATRLMRKHRTDVDELFRVEIVEVERAPATAPRPPRKPSPTAVSVGHFIGRLLSVASAWVRAAASVLPR